jgi:hypothetical protein
MAEQIATVVSWIVFILWKIIVFISFPLMILFAHQGYRLAYRKITGYEYRQQTDELIDPQATLINRQTIWRLLFWISAIALGLVWFKALDRRLLEFVLSVFEVLGFGWYE